MSAMNLGLVGVIFDVVRSSFRQRDQLDLRVRAFGSQQRVVDARVERVSADGVDIKQSHACSSPSI